MNDSFRQKLTAVAVLTVFACTCFFKDGYAADDAKSARIAVAANFAKTAQDLAKLFAKEKGMKVEIISGSTGKLYAQIQNGAPFDAFFAADVKRPKLLEEQKKIVAGSRRTYACGTIVLWSKTEGMVDSEGKVLKEAKFKKLAIANPKLAPYGAAAVEAMNKLDVFAALQGKIVKGNNIAQTYQYVNSGNAELGFVALSQIQQPGKKTVGSFWKVPAKLYSPIEQQAVLLNGNAAAKAFIEFLANEKAKEIITAYGYEIPSK